MKLDILFNRSEDENGYATFRIAPYKRGNGRNLLLNDIKIEEWSRGQGGGYSKYLRDKPVGKSIWVHSGSIEAFDSYDECKKDLLRVLHENLKQIIIPE